MNGDEPIDFSKSVRLKIEWLKELENMDHAEWSQYDETWKDTLGKVYYHNKLDFSQFISQKNNHARNDSFIS